MNLFLLYEFVLITSTSKETCSTRDNLFLKYEFDMNLFLLLPQVKKHAVLGILQHSTKLNMRVY